MAKTVAERRVDSYSSTSKSSGCKRTGVPGPWRRTALRSVLGRCRAKGSPGSQGLEVSSRSPPREIVASRCAPSVGESFNCVNKSFNACWAIWRIPLGLSFNRPPSRSTKPRSFRPWSAFCSRWTCFAASGPRLRRTDSMSTSGSPCAAFALPRNSSRLRSSPNCSATEVASAKREPPWPRMRWARFQSMSGVAWRRLDTRRFMEKLRSMFSIIWANNERNSPCCSEDSELNIASAAAARSAMARMTSSRFSAPGKKSPNFSMKSSKDGSRSSPRRSCSIIVERASIMSRIRASSSGSGEPMNSLLCSKYVSRTSCWSSAINCSNSSRAADETNS